MTKLLLIRHGETEWARNGRHTGRTDIGLTDKGRVEALAAARTLAGWSIERVVSSPLRRASETAQLVDLSPPVEYDDRLVEWDYGEYEGVTTAEMRAVTPNWSIWSHQPTTGETVDAVGARADDLVSDLVADGDPDHGVALFAHGHFLAVFIARWCGFPAIEGRRFKLQTATVSLLDTHREDRVLRVLNHRCGDVLPPLV